MKTDVPNPLTSLELPKVATSAMSPPRRFPTKQLAIFVAILTLCFGGVLIDLGRFALGSELFSHIVLVPFLVAWLIRQERAGLRSVATRSSPTGIIPMVLGFALLAVYGLWRKGGWQPAPEDRLFMIILAYYCLLLSGGLLILGPAMIRALFFPLAFLAFMVPFPLQVVNAVEVFLQHASAYAAHGMFALTGMPFVRNGLVFKLPGIAITVGQECSGVHSSLVLMMTALLAGHMFLRSTWKKAALAFLVIPLGIVRNGFRIWTISMLCVHVDVSMIRSPIHTRGGPLFFALSLVPFFLILLYLRKTETRVSSRDRSEK